MNNSPHKDVNIRIKPENKVQLDWFKKAYKFSSFSECVFYLYHFFKNNNISPRDNIADIISENFIDSKIEVKKIAANVKNIQNDFLTPMSRKIDMIFNSENFQTIEKRNQKLIEKENEPDIIRQKDKEIFQLTQARSSFKNQNNGLIKTVNEMTDNLKFYREVHQILIYNSTIEKQLFGKSKIYIDLELGEWEKILRYKDVFNRK